MTEEANRLILYIVVRNDLASMTAGKAAAQVSHASTQFMQKLTPQVKTWAREADGFGTAVILSAPIEDIYEIRRRCVNEGIMSGTVFDPGYPVRDGKYTHEVGITTCVYVFGRRGELKHLLSELSLL